MKKNKLITTISLLLFMITMGFGPCVSGTMAVILPAQVDLLPANIGPGQTLAFTFELSNQPSTLYAGVASSGSTPLPMTGIAEATYDILDELYYVHWDETITTPGTYNVGFFAERPLNDDFINSNSLPVATSTFTVTDGGGGGTVVGPAMLTVSPDNGIPDQALTGLTINENTEDIWSANDAAIIMLQLVTPATPPAVPQPVTGVAFDNLNVTETSITFDMTLPDTIIAGGYALEIYKGTQVIAVAPFGVGTGVGPAMLHFQGYKAPGIPEGGAVASNASGHQDPWFGTIAYVNLDGRYSLDQIYSGTGVDIQGFDCLSGTSDNYAFDFSGFVLGNEAPTFIEDHLAADYGYEYRRYDGTNATWTMYDISGAAPVAVASGTMDSLYMDIFFDPANFGAQPSIIGRSKLYVNPAPAGSFYDELQTKYNTATLEFNYNSFTPPIYAENPTAPLSEQYGIYDFDISVIPLQVANEDQAAPTGLAGAAPTSAANNDGKITGTTLLMEYKASSETTFIPATESEITGLAAGVYQVRYAAKTGFNPSLPFDVEVPAYEPVPEFNEATNTYAIDNAPELVWLANQVNSGNTFAGYTFILADNIDLSTYDWIPIGSNSINCFSGTFDGNGKNISNLTIGTSTNPNTVLTSLGLFGWISGAVISNISVKDFAIYSSKDDVYAGGLAGFAENSSITGSCVSGTLTAGDRDLDGTYIGGLIGFSEKMTIIDCYASVEVTGGYKVTIGGLVGFNFYDTLAMIANCYSTGLVTGGAEANVGGLIGLGGNNVTNSYYDTQTSGQSDTGKGTPLTTVQMKTQASYAGWDFTDTWQIIEDQSYPTLQWQAALPELFRFDTDPNNIIWTPETHTADYMEFSFQLPSNIVFTDTKYAVIRYSSTGGDPWTWSSSVKQLTNPAAEGDPYYVEWENIQFQQGPHQLAIYDGDPSQTPDKTLKAVGSFPYIIGNLGQTLNLNTTSQKYDLDLNFALDANFVTNSFPNGKFAVLRYAPDIDSNYTDITTLVELTPLGSDSYQAHWSDLTINKGRYELVIYDAKSANDTAKAIKAIGFTGLESAISGTVTSQTGAPLADIIVVVADTQDYMTRFAAITDQSGNYSINVPPGKQYIVLAYPGDNLQPYANTLYVAAGDDPYDFAKAIPVNPGAVIDFVLAPGGSISGTIYNEESSPISGVTVNCQQTTGGNWQKNVAADSNGYYIQAGLPYGVYTIVSPPADTDIYEDGNWMQSQITGLVVDSVSPDVTGQDLTLAVVDHPIVSDIWPKWAAADAGEIWIYFHGAGFNTLGEGMTLQLLDGDQQPLAQSNEINVGPDGRWMNARVIPTNPLTVGTCTILLTDVNNINTEFRCYNSIGITSEPFAYGDVHPWAINGQGETFLSVSGDNLTGLGTAPFTVNLVNEDTQEYTAGTALVNIIPEKGEYLDITFNSLNLTPGSYFITAVPVIHGMVKNDQETDLSVWVEVVDKPAVTGVQLQETSGGFFEILVDGVNFDQFTTEDLTGMRVLLRGEYPNQYTLPVTRINDRQLKALVPPVMINDEVYNLHLVLNEGTSEEQWLPNPFSFYLPVVNGQACFVFEGTLEQNEVLANDQWASENFQVPVSCQGYNMPVAQLEGMIKSEYLAAPIPLPLLMINDQLIMDVPAGLLRVGYHQIALINKRTGEELDDRNLFIDNQTIPVIFDEDPELFKYGSTMFELQFDGSSAIKNSTSYNVKLLKSSDQSVVATASQVNWDIERGRYLDARFTNTADIVPGEYKLLVESGTNNQPVECLYGSNIVYVTDQPFVYTDVKPWAVTGQTPFAITLAGQNLMGLTGLSLSLFNHDGMEVITSDSVSSEQNDQKDFITALFTPASAPLAEGWYTLKSNQTPEIEGLPYLQLLVSSQPLVTSANIQYDDTLDAYTLVIAGISFDKIPANDGLNVLILRDGDFLAEVSAEIVYNDEITAVLSDELFANGMNGYYEISLFAEQTDQTRLWFPRDAEFEIRTDPTAAQVIIPDLKGAPGSTVLVPVNVVGAAGLAGYQFDVTYDPAVAEVIAINNGTLMTGLFQPNITNAATGSVTIVGANSTGVNGDGTLCILSFTVKGQVGDSTVLTINNLLLKDDSAPNPLTLPSQAVNGSLTVAIKYGELTGDLSGEPNVGDVIKLLQHIAEISTLDPSLLVAADVDGNTGIDVGDAIVLMRKIAGLIEAYPVEEVPGT